MSSTYQTGGPPRFAHQRRGLNALIRTRGVCALLFDPGLGKTATVLDYTGLLALKSVRQEARVLVVCPLAAIDTWVTQAGTYLSPQVGYWAEAHGGTVLTRAEALAARGGDPHKRRLTRSMDRPKALSPRALHYTKAIALAARDADGTVLDDERLRRGPGEVHGPKVVLSVINLDTLAQRREHGSKTTADVVLDAIKRFDPDLVVVDESHKIKSNSANASRLLARLSKSVPRRILLTGTVMPHGPLDVYGQWRFLAPDAFAEVTPTGQRLPLSFGRFQDRYAKMGGWMGREVIGYKRLDELQEIMARNSIVARKEDALDLPPTTDVTVPVHLSGTEAKAYADMKDTLAADLATGGLATAPNRLAQSMRLRQITAGHLPTDDGAVRVIGDSKVRTVAGIVNDSLAGERRVVVFALFTHEVDQLADALQVRGTEVQVITGQTSTAERMRLRQRFGSDDRTRMVMIAQVKTMSVAVNELVTANHAVFASLSYQRDDLVQARDRLNRIGQKRPVTFWYTIAPGTIDAVILDAHTKRTDLESAVLQHISGSE